MDDTTPTDYACPLQEADRRHRFVDAEARREQRMRKHVNDELARFAHTHTILATAWVDVEAGPDAKAHNRRPLSVTLHDWCHADGAAHAYAHEKDVDDDDDDDFDSGVDVLSFATAAPTLTTPLLDPHPHLASLCGFEDLGTLRIDAEADLLGMLAATDDAEYDFCESESEDDETGRQKPSLAECVRQLRQRLQSGGCGGGTSSHQRPLQLWAFSARSETGASNVFAEADRALTWKWCKPDSAYTKQSGWFLQLHELLDHGSWNGGKNLTLLARPAKADGFDMFI
ncbi:hypothetical protein SCUCBS95973_007332 [Sporothrix curviconia]|uniref:BHLH domain-containing protein n=1 Tax=Sporothrix curviconia TaxID=1260050 RepID=A0ABP0CF81_9PEZI